MDQNSAPFMYLKNKFPELSDDKIKEGVFVGPQIRELKQDVKFEEQLSEVEKAAWKSFKNVTTNFLGNHKAENYRDKVADLAQFFKAMGCSMPAKVHFSALTQTSSQKISGQRQMSTDSDFTRTFPAWKSANQASGVPVC